MSLKHSSDKVHRTCFACYWCSECCCCVEAVVDSDCRRCWGRTTAGSWATVEMAMAISVHQLKAVKQIAVVSLVPDMQDARQASQDEGELRGDVSRLSLESII